MANISALLWLWLFVRWCFLFLFKYTTVFLFSSCHH
uniref:Uncharacterized protein n=1 Tax=Arundo donax TaxID=35708 RepID=A0A0A9A780_ARUDO